MTRVSHYVFLLIFVWKQE